MEEPKEKGEKEKREKEKRGKEEKFWIKFSIYIPRDNCNPSDEQLVQSGWLIHLIGYDD